jgi:hypothetical protein
LKICEFPVYPIHISLLARLLEHHSQFFLLVCIGQAFALGIVHM